MGGTYKGMGGWEGVGRGGEDGVGGGEGREGLGGRGWGGQRGRVGSQRQVIPSIRTQTAVLCI